MYQFLDFSVTCSELDQKIELIDDLPVLSHRIKITKTYKISSERNFTEESHHIKVLLKSLKVFRHQLQEYFAKDDLPQLQHDDDVLDFIQNLMSGERYLFCPFVRAFFKFDKGVKNEVQHDSYRSTSFAADNAF
jgi:hypothetical protein